MRYLLRIGSVCGVLVAAGLAGPAFAAPKTCTGRQKVCLDYCAKNYAKSPGCTSNCGDSINECMSTGCWSSKLVAKECGFAKQ